MPRNAEVIRQWTILREIERARGAGATIDDLASRLANRVQLTSDGLRAYLEAVEGAFGTITV